MTIQFEISFSYTSNSCQNYLGYEAGSRSIYRTWLAVSDRKHEGSFVYESDGNSLSYETGTVATESIEEC